MATEWLCLGLLKETAVQPVYRSHHSVSLEGQSCSVQLAGQVLFASGSRILEQGAGTLVNQLAKIGFHITSVSFFFAFLSHGWRNILGLVNSCSRYKSKCEGLGPRADGSHPICHHHMAVSPQIP